MLPMHVFIDVLIYYIFVYLLLMCIHVFIFLFTIFLFVDVLIDVSIYSLFVYVSTAYSLSSLFISPFIIYLFLIIDFQKAFSAGPYLGSSTRPQGLQGPPTRKGPLGPISVSRGRPHYRVRGPCGSPEGLRGGPSGHKSACLSRFYYLCMCSSSSSSSTR